MLLKEDRQMSLRSFKVCPGDDVTFISQVTWVAVSKMIRASAFFERKLGLDGVEVQPDGSRVYACGGGTSLHVYEAPALSGAMTETLATWYVTDLERVVAELNSNGVTFEQYDDPAIGTDKNGISATNDGKVARFKDPDGNTFAIEQ